MERFIHNENIRHFRKLLEREQDEEKRNLIRKLLAEEEAKDVPADPKDRQGNSKRS
jgi:hypothetical protein